MLRVEDLFYAYQKKDTIKNINFIVDKGEFTCLLGANGSGKTTILKCLNGILKPNQGDVYLDDKLKLSELKQRNIARFISMVPQEHTAIFSYQVIEVVIMGITPYLSFGRMPDEIVYKKAKKILRQLGILHLTSRKYNELSGGERQLVLIARALMQDTDYLVMDEPTSHLDFKNQYLLMREIKKLAQRGKGIITALHDPNLALKFCDKVIIIKEGKVLAQGRTEEIMTNHNLQETYGINVVIKEPTKAVEIVLPAI